MDSRTYIKLSKLCKIPMIIIDRLGVRRCLTKDKKNIFIIIGISDGVKRGREGM